MAGRDPAELTEVSVSLPFGIGSAKWKADPTEREAAWELYVELVTRVAVQPLPDGVGTVREAMNSLYSLFASTREILRDAGPKVGASRDSVGGIAIAVLNKGLRPFLSKWHPELQAWEAIKRDNVSPKAHEQDWELEPQARGELEVLRKKLAQYASELAKIAGIKGKNI
ncbi:MAG: hypothetical protein AAFY57_12020 [Cyanobacteria bacterium J06642_2]